MGEFDGCKPKLAGAIMATNGVLEDQKWSVVEAPPIRPLGPNFYQRILDRVRAKAEDAGVDGFLILDSANLIYTTGFFHRPSERPMSVYVPVGGEPILLVPHLEQENAQDNWIANIRTYPEFPGIQHPILWMIEQIGDRRIAVDTLEARLFAAASPGLDALKLSDEISSLRAVKEPEELVLVRAAASYADSCLEHIRQHLPDIVADGGTETDILAAGIGAALAKMKSQIGEHFDMTELGVVGSVHSGPRAALPHGHTTNRRPLPGEPIIAGIGATVGGYHAESGATFVLGEPSADTFNCLKVAAACDAAGIEALRHGATCTAVNDAALDAVRDAGLGQFLRHRIGHGMGIQGHEAPWLAPGDHTTLLPGMVFSNEPGIYRPEIDGYRTINTMIVTSGAAEVPSRFLERHKIDGRILPM